jgi:hypothetical protein
LGGVQTRTQGYGIMVAFRKYYRFIGDGSNCWLSKKDVEIMKENLHEPLDYMEGLIKINVSKIMPNKKTMWFDDKDFIECDEETEAI